MPAIQKVDDQATIKRWRNRWEALAPMFDVEEQRLKQLIKLHQQSSSLEPHFIRSNTLIQLLNGLSAFAKEQFQFFYRGFFDTNAHIFNEPKTVQNRRYKKFEGLSIPYAHDAVLATVLSQISQDLDVLARIISQRFSNLYDPNDELAIRLEEIDELINGAMLAMHDAFGFWTRAGTTGLTYFSSKINTRVIPYAPVVMVSLPLTAIKEDSDLLAIPHEVGHHLYWKSFIQRVPTEKKQLLRLSISNVTNQWWIYEWEEEIFADVVGCLIGGPAMVPGLQDLMKRYMADEFIHNDGEHPVPAIRPYILTHVLREKMQEKIYADEADEQWEDILQTRDQAMLDQVATVEIYNGSIRTVCDIKLADLKIIVLDMVDTMIESILLPNSSNGNSSKLRASEDDLRWSKVTDTFDKQQLLDNIRNRIGQEQSWDSTFNHYSKDGTILGTAENFWKAKLSEAVIPWLSQQSEWWDEQTQTISRLPPIPADDWIAIFEFGGWTTEGPVGKPHGGG